MQDQQQCGAADTVCMPPQGTVLPFAELLRKEAKACFFAATRKPR